MDTAASNGEKLRFACDEAFKRYPKSCSHAVWFLILNYVPDQQYMVANDLIDYVSSSSNWQEVALSDLSSYANRGELVIGGAKEAGHGHVIGVYPGDEKPRGVFFIMDKRTGKEVLARETGSYARAMSTSLGSYPGAISCGDKTVRDPWSEMGFKRVKFWRYIGGTPRHNAILQKTTRWSERNKGNSRTGLTHTSTKSSADLRWYLETDHPSLTRPEIITRWLK